MGRRKKLICIVVFCVCSSTRASAEKNKQKKTHSGQTGRTSGRRSRREDGLDTERGERRRGQREGGDRGTGGQRVAAEPRRRLDFLLDVVPEPVAWNRHSAASGGRRAVPSAPAG